jgi:hypothetical protein
MEKDTDTQKPRLSSPVLRGIEESHIGSYADITKSSIEVYLLLT